MSPSGNQEGKEHMACQIFGPDQDGNLYDLERQAVELSPEDLVRQENQPEQGKKETTQSSSNYHGYLGQRWPFNMFLKQPHDKLDSMARPIRQCCFICFRGKRNKEYAALVPCFRPKPQPHSKNNESQNGTKRSKMADSGHEESESDSTIYKRLNEVYYQHQPKFKRWIPFYGVVDVREVKFRSLGIKDKSNRHRVHIYRLNINEIVEEAENTIAISRHPDYWDTYGCCDEWHSDACPASTEYTAEPCIVKRVEAAQLRRNNLETYYLLTDCVRDPQSADEYETLKGMAQESPIIDLKGSEIVDHAKVFGRKNEMPGLEFIMGWQSDRMKSELAVVVFWISLIILSIWIVVIASGLAGEWSVSTALGQMALGSVVVVSGCFTRCNQGNA